MRVVEIREFGAPEVLIPTTRPDPALPSAGSGEILIKVLAAGINRPMCCNAKGITRFPLVHPIFLDSKLPAKSLAVI